MKRPQPNEYLSFYSGYIERVSDDVIAELKQQSEEIPQFLSPISPDKQGHSYAEGKWTLKELLGHMIDTERIMAYRLLRISRGDFQPLSGFDENQYVENGHFGERAWQSLVEELGLVRKSNLLLIDSLKEEQLNLMGEANGAPISVRALLFIMAGHLKHHIAIIKDRYLGTSF